MSDKEILNEEWTLSTLYKTIGKTGKLCSLPIANQFEYFYNLVNKQSNN